MASGKRGNGTSPQNFLEESIRIPCAISWPAGGVRQDVTLGSMVDHCDLYATLLDAAGVPEPAAGRAGRADIARGEKARSRSG